MKPPRGSSATVATGAGRQGVNTLTWNRKLRGKKAARGKYKLSVVALVDGKQAMSPLTAQLR